MPGWPIHWFSTPRQDCAGVCQSSWWAAVCGKCMHECRKGFRGRQVLQNKINITFRVIYNHHTPSFNPSIGEVWSGVTPQAWYMSSIITSSHQSWCQQTHQSLFQTDRTLESSLSTGISLKLLHYIIDVELVLILSWGQGKSSIVSSSLKPTNFLSSVTDS